MTELDTIVKALKRQVEELCDAQVRQRRLLADLLYNLDEENMPAVKEIISRYRTENGEAIAAISLRTEENAAAVSAVAQHQKDVDSTVAGIGAKADANAASITQIAKVQTEQEKTVASIGSKADANAARIEQVALAQDEQDESIASIESKADANSASISQLASTQTEHGESIAAIEAKVDDEGAEIRLEVERVSSVADGAADVAGKAKSAANAAQSSADAAQGTASEAKTAASNAQKTADDNTASITQLARVQTEQGESIASVESKANANAASITQLAATQTEHGESIAAIEAKVDDEGAEIRLEVERVSSIADGAADEASKAKNAANAAQSSADAAQGTASEAKTAASNAQKTADDNTASITQLARVQTEQGESIASIESKANANAASITQLARVQTEQGESIASIESKANANAASITQLASTQTEHGESIAAIEAKVDDEAAEIRLEVERVDGVAADAAEAAGYAREEASAAQSTADSASEAASSAQSTANEAKANSSNGAYIIARINADGSIVKISADKLELSGYATFASLENEGTTSIHGANIITGTVDADVLKTGGVGQTGTVLGNNLMFNAGAVKYSDAEARYLFFVDPALYNVFIGVEGGSDAKILRIHSEGNGLFDSYNGERLYLGSIAPGNDLVTRSEVSDMIAAALEGLDVPTEIYAPHISPESGDYAMPVTVEITNYNSTGDVYYTISGAGSADGTYLYTGPFDIYDTVEDYVTVSAYCRTDHGDSEEASVSYYLSA